MTVNRYMTAGRHTPCNQKQPRSVRGKLVADSFKPAHETENRRLAVYRLPLWLAPATGSDLELR